MFLLSFVKLAFCIKLVFAFYLSPGFSLFGSICSLDLNNYIMTILLISLDNGEIVVAMIIFEAFLEGSLRVTRLFLPDFFTLSKHQFAIVASYFETIAYISVLFDKRFDCTTNAYCSQQMTIRETLLQTCRMILMIACFYRSLSVDISCQMLSFLNKNIKE